MIFHCILLECCNQIQTERTASSIYHLLRGRRSIQTVQDAHLFKLERYFGIYKNLLRNHFNHTMELLQFEGLLKRVNSSQMVYETTPATADWFTDIYKTPFPFESFAGLAYHEIMDPFFDRLLLLIQTLTNSKMDYFSFIPVIDNPVIETWVKVFYRKVKNHEEKYLKIIYQELRNILQYVSSDEAGLFIDRLTGYKNYGMSINQLSSKYNLSVDDVQLIIVNIIHRLLSVLHNEKNNYPFLAYIINDISNATLLSNSAFQTSHLLGQGYSIEKIASIRNLKINTIHDHLIEIAFYETDFPLYHYVTKEEHQDILNAIQKTNSSKLRDIKQQVNNDISYFQIRLILALHHKQI
ncbi:helix-turn-helix domain-containing protein [Oceanobacillus chungangensis]|uniref:Helicase Helix-turn-helix domain-containing protein n=1 Tax=Oceanobacillus chungangensis TaxID=1229152 RepID=A0A3D8Q1V6_9BACI|nr:helix-turn-helix domain-containing protein [Oceanobacillus chungangensis]RDW22022.1 hypothetical protein CWR45_00595 [Oceanobacillus chungangensis]